MNPIIENILTRRSVRAFKTQQIPKADLELIVDAAIHAPSGKNQQSWKFTIIQKPVLISELAEQIANEMAIDKETYNFYHATTLILVSNRGDNTNAIADTGAAMENIFLAANSLSIGSVWINQLKTICDIPVLREFLNKIDIPKDHVVYGIAALGYTDMKPAERIIAPNTVSWFL